MNIYIARYIGYCNIAISLYEDKVKEYVLSKYKDILDKQAEPIIDKFKNDLEVFWDQIIFINCKDCENTFFYDLGDIVIRSYNKE